MNSKLISIGIIFILIALVALIPSWILKSMDTEITGEADVVKTIGEAVLENTDNPYSKGIISNLNLSLSILGSIGYIFLIIGIILIIIGIKD